MIIMHTNLQRWENDGLLAPFGLQLKGLATEPLLGIRFRQLLSDVRESQLTEQDIILSHEENAIDELTNRNWEAATDIFLVIHQKNKIAVFQRIAEKYPDKKVYFRFERAFNGESQMLLRALSSLMKAKGHSAYQKALGQFCRQFEADALHHLLYEILNDAMLFDAGKWANAPHSDRPYLWRRFFSAITPGTLGLIRQHANAAAMTDRTELHTAISKSLSREFKKSAERGKQE